MHMKEHIQMYFDPVIVADFAELEQNEKNFKVADIVDQVIMHTVGELHQGFAACELGWWAHPDRYHRLFDALIQNNGTIDRVDISPYMLALADKYIDTDAYRARKNVIKLIEHDIVSYLTSLPDDTLDLAIMKYTIDHIADIDELFSLLSQKLKTWWALVSSVGVLSPELKSISTNARFFYNGASFPENETRILQDGDTFTVKFFNVSGQPDKGFIPWWETTKYYHSAEKYKTTWTKYGFTTFVGNRKELLPNEQEQMEQAVLVLKK